MFGIPAQYLTVWLLVLNWCRKNLFETSIAEITCSSVADKNVAIISAWIGNDRLIEHMRQQHTIHMCFTLSYHYPCTTWNLHVLPCYLGFHFAFFRPWIPSSGIEEYLSLDHLRSKLGVGFENCHGEWQPMNLYTVFSIFCDVLFIVSHIGFMYGIKLTLPEVDLYGTCREIYQSRVL